MSSGLKKQKIDISTPDPKPIFTVLLICQMPFFVTTGKIDWVEKTAFIPLKFGELLGSQNVVEMTKYVWTATFAELTQWIWILNALFFWVFGYVLERKMKGWRYPAFIALSMAAAWIAVYATAGFNVSKAYIGPSMLLFSMLGGYFAYFPKKPFEPQQWLRPTTEIFRNDKPTPAHERYWVSPWAYVMAFAIFQVALQASLAIGKDGIVAKTHIEFLGTVQQLLCGRMQVQALAFPPIAAGLAVISGALIAQLLPKLGITLRPMRPGGKLQVEVIQHYRELRTLDLTHDQACEGAAKFAAVPIEIAKDWIKKGDAGLKDQEIK